VGGYAGMASLAERRLWQALGNEWEAVRSVDKVLEPQD